MNNQEIAKKSSMPWADVKMINSVAHCATRLRVMVKDEEKINKEVIENLEKFKVLSLTQVNTKSSWYRYS